VAESLAGGYLAPMATFHELEVTTINGERASLGDYAGKLCLIVNLASR
jgi:glutathione peroxidase